MREPQQGSLWPIHPKPFNDEILSSWLSRTAEGHGFTLTQFLEQNLPRALGVGFDIDLVTDRQFLDTVAAGMFSLATEVERATFIPDEGTIFSDNDPLHLEWIVPLRLNARAGNNSGLPFCPSCLGSDSKPYYRKQWRIGFFPVCPAHGLLQTNCPHCGHPYAYHGFDSEKWLTIGTGRPGSCRSCGRPFSASSQPSGKLARAVTEIQRELSLNLSAGWRSIDSFGQVPVYIYLRGLRLLASIFQRKVGAKVAAWIQGRTQTELSLEQAVLGSPFERQTPKLRAVGLFAADWLAGEWPTRFTSMMKELEIRATELLPAAKDRPYWLCHPDIAAVFPRQPQLEEAEIESARIALTKMLRWPVTKAQTIAYMRQLVPPTARLLHPSGNRPADIETDRFLGTQNDFGRTKKRPAPPTASRVSTLYKAFRPPYDNRPVEIDILHVAEDIQSLLLALRCRNQDEVEF